MQTIQVKLFRWTLAFVILGVSSGTALGQGKPAPHLLLAYPLGGQAGTSLEVTVTGQNLEAPEDLYFSIPGVKAQYVGPGSGPATVTMRKGQRGGMKAGNSFKFKVALPKDARAGIHDVRVITKGGISNPRAFVVGAAREFIETEPNDDVPQAQRVELNSTVNGSIATPTDVDYFVFAGKKGQRVVISCLTTSIDSKLPAMVELYGSGDTYLGSNRGYNDNDAVLDSVLPGDGDYYVRVACFTYTQGGAEYFYRLSISTAPWIDAVFPGVVESGQTTQVTVYGRNLPGGQLDPTALLDGRALEKLTMPVKVPGDALSRQRLDYSGWIAPSGSGLDGVELRLRNEAGLSNPALLTLAAAKVVLDNGSNNTPETAQQITVPCEIAGRIDKKGDRDWYAFQAKKGEIYSIEAFGDRLGSPLDLYFILRDSKGKTITEQDDSNEVLSPLFFTRNNDPPRYKFVVPADGTYQLMISSRDAFVSAGPRHRYQVRITPEHPDFRLVIIPTGTAVPPQALLPDAARVGQGGNQALQVLVWRQDGFNEDILLTAKGLPAGISIPPQVLPSGQKQSYVVVSASPQAAAWTGPITLIGTATVSGKKLVREARSATITWPVPQVNIPAISRLDRSLVLAVRDKAPFNLTAESKPYSVLPGGKINVPVKLTRLQADLKGPIQVVALSVPTGITVGALTLAPGKDSGTVVLDVKRNSTPGTVTVLLRGQTQGSGKQKQGRAPVGAVTQPSTPINITILPKQLANLVVTPQNVKLPVGKEATVTLKVTRQYDFEGPFKLEVVPAKGIQGNPAQIAAGQNQTQLIIRATDGATPGSQPTVTVRATAQFHGHQIVHEAKLSVSVVKAR